MPSDAERSQHWGGRRGAAPTARTGDAAGNLVEASAADSPPPSTWCKQAERHLLFVNVFFSLVKIKF